MKKERLNIMTEAGIQPFCRANIVIIGYFNGTRVFPGSVTERNIALYLYNNQFCSKLKSENVRIER